MYKNIPIKITININISSWFGIRANISNTVTLRAVRDVGIMLQALVGKALEVDVGVALGRQDGFVV